MQPTTLVMSLTTGAVAAATTPQTTSPTSSSPTTSTKGTSGSKSFADELKKSTGGTSSTPAARPKDEKTTKVSGHPYERITNGDDKGRYLNQLAGSPRKGEVFTMFQRDGHTYHAYGSGTDRYVAMVPEKSSSGTATTGTSAPTTKSTAKG